MQITANTVKNSLLSSLLLVSFSTSVMAQEPAPLAGIWSIGETRSCDTGNAWVFLADGFYAEVKLKSRAISAAGIWRDEGDAIAYTHTHVPFIGHEKPMRVRHLTVDERTAEQLTTKNYRGETLVFHRCPADALIALKSNERH